MDKRTQWLWSNPWGGSITVLFLAHHGTVSRGSYQLSGSTRLDLSLLTHPSGPILMLLRSPVPLMSPRPAAESRAEPSFHGVWLTGQEIQPPSPLCPRRTVCMWLCICPIIARARMQGSESSESRDTSKRFEAGLSRTFSVYFWSAAAQRGSQQNKVKTLHIFLLTDILV